MPYQKTAPETSTHLMFTTSPRYSPALINRLLYNTDCPRVVIFVVRLNRQINTSLLTLAFPKPLDLIPLILVSHSSTKACALGTLIPPERGLLPSLFVIFRNIFFWNGYELVPRLKSQCQVAAPDHLLAISYL